MPLTRSQLAARGLDDEATPAPVSTPDAAEPEDEAPAPALDGKKIKLALDFASQQFGVDKGVLAGMLMRESNADEDVAAGRRKSSAGAVGLMQFMPATAKRYGIDPTDPYQSIIGAAAYMADNLKRFNGDYAKAIAAYNWGEGNVEKQGLDNAPDETRKYLAFVQDFAKQSGLSTQASAPAARNASMPLPQGVTPSTAGGGRGGQGGPTADELGDKPGLIADTWTGLKQTGLKVAGALAREQANTQSQDVGKGAQPVYDPMTGAELGTGAETTQADVDASNARAVELARRANKEAPQRWSGEVAAGLAYVPAGPVAPLVAMGAEGNAIYQQLVDNGIDQDTAKRTATMAGGVQGLAQLMPMGKIVGNAGAKQFVASVAKATAKSAAVGAGQSVVGDVAQAGALKAGGYDEQADKQLELGGMAERAGQGAAFMAGLHVGGQGAGLIKARIGDKEAWTNQGTSTTRPDGSTVPPLGDLAPADQLKAAAGDRVSGADTQKAKAIDDLTKATTVDDAIKAATDLAVRPKDEPAPRALDSIGTPDYAAAEQARLAKLQDAIDKHGELLDEANKQANSTEAEKAQGLVADQLARDMPETQRPGAIPEVGDTPLTKDRTRYDGPLRQVATDDARAQAGLPSSADSRTQMPLPGGRAAADVIPGLRAPEGVRVTDAENIGRSGALPDSTPTQPGRSEPVGDLTPMTPMQAKQRLVVMRDQLKQQGGDPSTLVITPHPDVKGKLAIKSTDPAHAFSKTERQPARDVTAEPGVVDPVKAYVDGKRAEATPQAREFVRAFDKGELTHDDVRSVMERESAARRGDTDVVAGNSGLAEGVGPGTHRMIKSDSSRKPRGESAERDAIVREGFVPPEKKAPPEKPPVDTEPPEGPPAPPGAPPGGVKTLRELFPFDKNNSEQRSAYHKLDLSTVVAQLAKHPNPMFNRIAELLKPILGRVRLIPSKAFDWRKFPTAGGVHTATWGGKGPESAVALRAKDRYGLNHEGDEHVMAHELAHALSAHAIYKPTPAQRPIVDRLQKLYDYVKPIIGSHGHYGMTNLHEFHSEGWTNPQFQEALHNIAMPKGKGTAWGKFTATVATLLGVPPGRHTAFTEFMTHADALSRAAKQSRGLDSGQRSNLDARLAENPARDPQVIELRKRHSVLKSILECMG